jgi:capsid assembly protease
MSDLIARGALQRMNLNPVAIAAAYSNISNDLMQMSKADAVEQHAKFMEHRRAELCAAYGFSPQEQNKPFAFAGGIAIIPVTGTLINRFGGSYGYVTGYNFLRAQTNLALADDDVKGILYDVSSYGGEVAGCFETAAEIFNARGKKPSMAFVDSSAYSAGYAIASGAGRIVSTPSGGAGSIGVVVMHMDMSKMLKDFGVDITFIHFGEHKVDGNPYEALPPSVKKSIQASVNKTGESFVALMAKHRDLKADVVRDTEAATFRAEEALALGLIDAIASPEEAVQAFLGELSGSKPQPVKKESAMTTATEPGASTTPAPDAAAQAAAQAAAAAASTAAQTAATAQAATATAAAEARTAERARVSGIMGCEEAKGREGLANHFAMHTDMSVDDAKKALAAAPAATAKATANPLEKAMNATGGGPNVGTEGGPAADGAPSAAAGILAAQTAMTGIKHAAK